jgi:hypothetical protein
MSAVLKWKILFALTEALIIDSSIEDNNLFLFVFIFIFILFYGYDLSGSIIIKNIYEDK